MSDIIIEVDDSNFKQEILNSDIPAVVDFWAPWCGPCKSFSPLFEEVGQEYAGKVKAAKMNIDSNPQIPEVYGIMAIPYLLFFKDGEIVEQIKGTCQKDQLKETFERLL